ncbi:MAG: hypothetical protein GY795_34445 [Desulfobacterales bacterium]|nr:hypothetical protein [Desulfobacterales bacterium]
MKNVLHTFHIPVMGTGHSADTPVRVAHFGISSVISIVDDFLLEKMRKYYCNIFNLPYMQISGTDTDARAKRITAYLDAVREIVRIKMDKVRKLPFFEDNDKKKYFDLLPSESSLKQEYEKFIRMPEVPDKDRIGQTLTQKMKPGAIDVNIMVKLDKVNYNRDGSPMSDEFSDAKASLRGYADSGLESGVVFSAGINKSLFSYMTQFRDFYRDETGKTRKKIILKVSDFRSAMIQGRFLARKGLEVFEYRIESGLNCGGHAFPTNGHLLPCLIQEFKDKRDQLVAEFRGSIQKYYETMGWIYPESALSDRPLITVQGGIGSYGEDLRLRKDFGMDMTGWASPFLLVPEATCVDDTTRVLLEKAGKKDLYMSKVSPLGVPFNNVHNSGSEEWTFKMAAHGNPGSSCPKQILVSDTEFSKTPICLSSRQYQKKKLIQIQDMDISKADKEKFFREITEKACLCGHLGNGALIALGIADEKNSPQLICPGPNIEWFTRSYTLKEMVDHIYGRGHSLVSSHRPHMFAKELKMYVDYFENMAKTTTGTDREMKYLKEFKDNLRAGMDFCMKISEGHPYPGENLASIKTCVEKEGKRLKSVYMGLKKKIKPAKVIKEKMSRVEAVTV